MKISVSTNISTDTGTFGRVSVEAATHKELMELTISDLLGSTGYSAAARTAQTMSVALITKARDACPAVIYLSSDPKVAGKELVKKLKKVKKIK